MILRKLFLPLCFMVLQTNMILSQTDLFTKSNEYRREAHKKYNEKDFKGFLENNIKAGELRENHPAILYNIAAGYSLLNQKREALESLNKLAEIKLYYPVEKDSDFVSIWNDKEFLNTVSEMKQNLNHVGKSEIAFKLNEKDLLIESVAYDPITKSFFVGSVHKRKIFSIDENKKVEVFADSNDSGIWGVFGMRVDPKNRILWACSGPNAQMIGFNESDHGTSGVFKFDIDSKKLLGKYILSNENAKHFFGDLTLDSDGNVYVSDSRHNAIYKIDKNKKEIELFIEPGNFASLQGIDFSYDEKYLFAADYALGTYRIDMKTKEVKKISIPSNLTELAIDGFYFYKNNLIAIQNGISPHRIVKLILNDDFDSILDWKIIEANNPNFIEPTLGVITGNEFYYIANSQWPYFNADGTVEVDKLKLPVILKTKLE